MRTREHRPGLDGAEQLGTLGEPRKVRVLGRAVAKAAVKRSSPNSRSPRRRAALIRRRRGPGAELQLKVAKVILREQYADDWSARFGLIASTAEMSLLRRYDDFPVDEPGAVRVVVRQGRPIGKEPLSAVAEHTHDGVLHRGSEDRCGGLTLTRVSRATAGASQWPMRERKPARNSRVQDPKWSPRT